MLMMLFASAVPLSVGVLSLLVVPLVGEVIAGANGAAVSAVKFTAGLAALTLPPASVEVAVKL